MRGVRAYLIFFLLIVAGYLTCLTHGYLIDDHQVLFGQTGVENRSFVQLFENSQNHFYRPVGHVILWASFQLFGNQPFPAGYRLVNLFLFFAVVCLFFKIVLSLTKNKDIAFWSACLYAVHPINSMYVNYITANTIATGVLAQQISLLLFLSLMEKGGKISAASLLFFVLSLLSHETNILLPVYIFIISCFIYKKGLRDSWMYCQAYAGVVCCYLAFRALFFPIHKDNGAFIFSWVENWGTYFTAVWGLIVWYVSKLLVPFNIVFLWSAPLDYQVVETAQGNMVQLQGAAVIGASILAFLAVAALAIYLVLFKWKRDYKSAALLIAVCGLLPTFVIAFTQFPYTAPYIEPHWFFFSSFGFFMLMGGGLVWIKERIGPKIWPAVAAAVVCYLLVFLNENNVKWKTQETYCRYWLSLNQGNMTPFLWLGKSLIAQGKYDEAIRWLQEGADKGHYIDFDVMIAQAYARFLKGDTEAAYAAFKEALKSGPRSALLHHYLGQYYISQKQWPQAREAYEAAVKFFPHNKQYHNILMLLSSGWYQP